MLATPDEQVIALGEARAAPRLSVVTPFYKHDPSAMLARMAPAPQGVEFVLLDDGSNDATLINAVITAAAALNAPVRIIILGANKGRAAGRNRLIAEARGQHFLFLDADMLPDSPHFLRTWLGVIETQAPMVAFGGLSLAQTTCAPGAELHYNLFRASDCRNARQRARRPAQSVATANLLVRRDVLAATPFDGAFIGWGFEDVDWALSAAQDCEIMHVENSATHAGLDDIDTLMRKNKEAGPNFARLASKHPQHVSRFAAHRLARVLKHTPARDALREACAWVARDPIGAAPMTLRRAALKLHRATHFAEHLP